MSIISKLGFSAIRSGVKPFKLGYILERYRKQYRLMELLNHQRVNVVLDVGGSNGMWAHGIRGIGFKGPIFSFEPIEEEMRKARALNGSDPLWKGIVCAVGAEDGTRMFNVIEQGSTAFCSSFLAPTSLAVTRAVEVKVGRLDSLMSHSLPEDPRIFLKTDTQGFDLEVLKGCGKLLDSVAVLQMEMSVRPVYQGMTHHLEAMAYLESLGFVLAGLDVVDRIPDGRVVEYDAMMVRN